MKMKTYYLYALRDVYVYTEIIKIHTYTHTYL